MLLSFLWFLHGVVSQFLLCPGFVQVMFVAFGKVVPACAWTPLFWALRTWPGSEDAEATSSGAMVCVWAVLCKSTNNGTNNTIALLVWFLQLSVQNDFITNYLVICFYVFIYFGRCMHRVDGGEPRWGGGGHWTLQHIPGDGGCHTRFNAASWTGSCQEADQSYCQHIPGHQGYCFWEARVHTFSFNFFLSTHCSTASSTSFTVTAFHDNEQLSGKFDTHPNISIATVRLL